MAGTNPQKSYHETEEDRDRAQAELEARGFVCTPGKQGDKYTLLAQRPLEA